MLLACFLTAGLLIPPCGYEPPPPPPPIPTVWLELAVCESGMNGEPRWDYNGSSGFDGGLQFHPRTWAWLAPEGFPSYAHEASPEDQIAVAEIVLDRQGWGAWPACSEKLGYR